MNANRADVIATTGRLVTKMSPTQLDHARAAAARHGVTVTEYLRRRLVPRILGRQP